MKPDDRFVNQDLSFWSNIRLISQLVGYTDRKSKQIKVPTIEEIKCEFLKKGLNTEKIEKSGVVTEYGNLIIEYFLYRSNFVRDACQYLMDVDEARRVFNDVCRNFPSGIKKPPLPMNKQKGDKKNYAYFTCIINLLISQYILGENCDFDPRELTLLTENGCPFRTLSRRVDGCYPSTIDPVALWEIKEYYYTTTFGSRVADGVYETLVDGLELNEIQLSKKRKIRHYLMIDSYQTWWVQGRSYLCRMVDMLNMGMVDEILFGKEVISRIPDLVRSWG